MKLMYWIDKFFNKLFPPPSSRGEGLWHTVGFTGVEDGTEFKDASWDVDIRHCVAVGLVKKVTFLGGAVVANVAEIKEWEDGVFRGGTLVVKKWHDGTFEGDTFHGKWYGGVWKGKHFKGIDLSGSGLELAREQ